MLNEVCEIIEHVDVSQLSKKRVIQGNEVSVMEAIYHVVEHFSMHALGIAAKLYRLMDEEPYRLM